MYKIKREDIKDLAGAGWLISVMYKDLQKWLKPTQPIKKG